MFVGGALTVPLLFSRGLCIEVGAESDDVAKAELIGTIIFVSGIVTFLQTTFGTRYCDFSVNNYIHNVSLLTLHNSD